MTLSGTKTTEGQAELGPTLSRFEFTARLFRPPGPRMMTILPVPRLVVQQGHLRARQRLRGHIDAVHIASSLLSTGTGILALVINKELLRQLGKQAGDRVTAALELDRGGIRVSRPAALRDALQANPDAEAFFKRLAPSNQKAFVSWIREARLEATRDRRLRAAIEMLAGGRTLR